MPETILWYYFTLQNYYKKREHSNFLTHKFFGAFGGGISLIINELQHIFKWRYNE